LKTYHELRPVHNHPACLLIKAAKASTVGTDASSTKPAALPSKTSERSANGNGTKDTEKPQDSSADAGLNEKAELASVKAETMDHPVANVSNKAEKSAFDPTEIIELLSDSDMEMDLDEVVQKDDEEDEPSQIPGKKATPAKQSQSEKYDDDLEEEWYARIARRYGAEKMSQVENGNKVVMLLHILVHASILDEKVVLFSQCLKVRRKKCIEDTYASANSIH
jgi:hypothetical protein